MTSVYYELHPELQRALVQGAGWRELRPIQELAYPPVVAGDNCLVLAPTAGGKTEAALIPTLELLLRERREGLRVLYVCPLKALLNNQFARLSRWAGWVGMGVFLWHGDTGSADRQRFLREPCEILMTTPESLEVLLSSCGPRGRGSLWEHLRLVIVDEIHAFAGEERGDHLACLLERLTQGRDLQRLGLSATVGNPQRLLEWLQGSSLRKSSLVDPGKVKSKKLIQVLPWEEEAHRHLQVSRLTGTGKSLVFVDSRRKAEELVQSLQGADQVCFLHHASLSEEARHAAELAFQTSPQACIVCTSTMELGLDVGDLDRVVQVGSPNTVGSFLQRLGRSGRRDQPAQMAFVTDEHWSFLQSCALLQLARQGYVEPLEPSRRSLAVFAQQALVRALADGGASEEQLLADSSAYCFREIGREEKRQIFDHLCLQGLLERADARLVLGEASARKLGGNGYIELYSVFASAHQYQVVTSGGRSIGQLDAWFAWSLRGQTEASFALGGSHWTILDIDKERSQVIVEVAPGGSLPQWHGPPRLLGRRLCGAIRELLTGEDEIGFLDNKGQMILRDLRDSWQVRLQQAAVNLEIRAQGQRLYTFAGGKINQVLALVWQQVHNIKPTFNNFYLHFSDDFGDLESVMRRLQDPTPLELGSLLPPLQLNKFQQFLPPELERIYRAERLLDEDGARSLAVDAWSIVELASAR